MGKLKTRNLWLGLALLLILTPLGLIAEGAAWAEWGGEELRGMVGFVPAGLQSLEGIWRAPAGGYMLPILGGASGYVLSGVIGVLAVVGVTWLLGRVLSRSDGDKG
ncbi:MAG: PDGLE domain-containing protein [Chloroflexota bacterium]